MPHCGYAQSKIWGGEMKFKQQSKYGNTKCKSMDGQKFDSIKERNRYYELQLMQKAGIITNLRRQVKFVLIPKQDGEREVAYKADFVYEDRETGLTVVEDVKSIATKTAEYIIKRKLMLYFFGIKIREIE